MATSIIGIDRKHCQCFTTAKITAKEKKGNLNYYWLYLDRFTDCEEGVVSSQEAQKVIRIRCPLIIDDIGYVQQDRDQEVEQKSVK